MKIVRVCEVGLLLATASTQLGALPPVTGTRSSQDASYRSPDYTSETTVSDKQSDPYPSTSVGSPRPPRRTPPDDAPVSKRF